MFLQYKMMYFYVDIYFVSLQVSGVMSFLNDFQGSVSFYLCKTSQSNQQ